jgi:hypothetical protein
MAENAIAKEIVDAAFRIHTTLRTPDVVEFAVSPQVGQAVVACPPFYWSSGAQIQCGRAGEHRLPHLRSSAL